MNLGAWRIWLPATVAAVAAAGALGVAGWAAFGWPVALLDSWLTGGDRTAAAPVMVAALGVVATVSAVLVGVGELRHALPPQRLSFFSETVDEGGNMVVFLGAQNVGAHISSWYVHSDFRAHPPEGFRPVNGRAVHAMPFDGPLHPEETRPRITQFTVPPEQVDQVLRGHHLVRWSADRSYGRSVRVPLTPRRSWRHSALDAVRRGFRRSG